jgi:hypothetical protein
MQLNEREASLVNAFQPAVVVASATYLAERPDVPVGEGPLHDFRECLPRYKHRGLPRSQRRQ